MQGLHDWAGSGAGRGRTQTPIRHEENAHHGDPVEHHGGEERHVTQQRVGGLLTLIELFTKKMYGKMP